MSTDYGTVPGRVARGVAFLVEHGPKLRLDIDRIDPDTLRVQDVQLCPLAQSVVEPTPGEIPFSEGGDRIFRGMGNDVPWLGSLGFTSTTFGSPDEYDRLNTEWRRVLTERRASVTVQ